MTMTDSAPPWAARSKPVILTRDVTRDECGWLPRDFRAGERLWTFHGVTYGVVGDGAALTEARAVPPFHEFPQDAWRYE